MLTATLFGRPRLSYAGEPLPWSAPPKTLPLLAYLVLAGGTPIERDAAAFALWPDVADAQARTNLRRHIFYLERALPAEHGEPWVARDGAAIRLNSRRTLQCDVHDFKRLATADADEAQLESARRLYTGELLCGYDEEWILPERRRLYERYLEVLERLLARAMDRHDLTLAIAHADRLLQLEPWREHYVRTIMRLRQQTGERCGALDLYADFSKRLQETYNISPSPETIRLKELIEENGTLQTAAGNLPAALTPFVGREAEVEELGRRLKHTRLLTIAGIGGVGKTRLALHVAENAAYRFDSGIWYVDLTGRDDDADITSILSGTLRSSDGIPALHESPASRLRNARALLVFDGCERFVEPLRTLAREILTACREVRILAIGRTPLHMEGETIWRVDPLSPRDAEALFVDRARGASKSFAPTPQNAKIVAQLCARLEGVPLALELAAARLESCSLEELLRAHAARKPEGPLASALAWSYESLSEPARALYRGIAVFSGGWTLEAAQNVCFDEPASPSETLELLAELGDTSLVSADLSSEPARYSCLEIVREHARRLNEGDREERLRRRHAQYYAAFALDLESQREYPAWRDALARFSIEQSNFDAALRYLLAERRDVQCGVQVALALWRFWRESGLWTLGRNWLMQALSLTADTPMYRAHVLHRLASLARISGDYEEARALYEQALELARSLEDRHLYADALFAVAFSAMKQGDLVRAQDLANEALSVQLRLENDAGIAHARNTLGSIALNHGDSTGARDAFEQALAFFEIAGDERNAGVVVGNLGLCALYEGNLPVAIEAFNESAERSRSAGNRQFVAYMLQQHADARLLLGESASVAPILGESLAIAQEIGDKDALICILETASILSGLRGRRASSRCLMAAAARARTELRIPLQRPERAVYERKLSLLSRMPTIPRTSAAMPLRDALAIARSEIEAARNEAVIPV